MQSGKGGAATGRPDAVGRGSNSVAVRRYNAQLVLATLRRLSEASKADLARATALTQNTVGLIVDELTAEGLLSPAGRRSGGRGQPSTLMALAPDGVWSIGVKVGRSATVAVLVDFCGDVLRTVKRERPLPDPETALQEALSLIDELRAAGRRRPGRFAGVGIAMPFDLDSWRRELGLVSERLDAWRGYDFVGRLRARLDLPVFGENDGTAAAVAELFKGHGRTLEDFVSVTIASAIGGGVVLGGHYRHGATGNAGDIGLMPVSVATEPGGDKLNGFEILLARASIATLTQTLRDRGLSVDTEAALDAAIAGNPDIVAAWIEDCAQALTDPLLAIGAILDLDAVTIDGDLDGALLARLVARLTELTAAAAAEARSPPRLLQGEIGRDAAAIGAALLPLHLNFTPDPSLLMGAAA